MFFVYESNWVLIYMFLISYMYKNPIFNIFFDLMYKKVTSC